MSLASHIKTLATKHQDIDRQVSDLVRHQGSDDLDVSALKKEKLRIKDRITRLSRST